MHPPTGKNSNLFRIALGLLGVLSVFTLWRFGEIGLTVVENCANYTNVFASSAPIPRVYSMANRSPCTIASVLKSDKLKFYAYYFPQFHNVVENRMQNDWSLFNGSAEEFSYANDTTRVNRILKPQNYHFYDARNYYLRRTQGRLATEHGIDGFIYYHYFFESGAALGDPVELRLIDGEPNVDFAFLWMAESLRFVPFVLGDPLRHAIYLLKFFRHPAYIRKNGRPVLYLSDMKSLDSSYLAALNNFTRMLTGSEIHYCQMVTSAKDPYWPGAASYAEYASRFGSENNIDNFFEHAASTRGKDVELGLMLNFDNFLRVSSKMARETRIIPTRKPDEIYKICVQKLRDEKKFRRAGLTVMSIFAWNEWSDQAALEPNDANYNYLGAIKRCKEDYLTQ